MAKTPAQGPRFVRYFGPTLDALRARGSSATPSEVVEEIAKHLGLGSEILDATTSTGQSRFEKDVHFARFYLAKDGLIDGSERGIWRLTEKGRATELPQNIALELFNRVHAKFSKMEKDPNQVALRDDEVELPEAGEAVFAHRGRLASLLKGLTAKGFEDFSALLLRRAGFVEVHVTGRSNDGGIDGYGLLRTNPIVTQRVIFQCKRYAEAPVPKDDVMKFQAAVIRDRADKGVFLTTSLFTKPARTEASNGACQIELIDIERLMDLIEQFELGVQSQVSYSIDDAFFAEFAPRENEVN